MDPSRYWSTEWARQEWEHVWRRCWLYAVPVQDVREPGSWATFELGRESVLIVRGDDGTLHAFYNVCQHRGRRLMDGERGHAAALRCGYHAWTYRLDGSLRTVHEPQLFPADLDVCALGLRAIRVDTWGGFVFVCLDPDAVPLDDYLEDVPSLLGGFPLHDYALVREQTIEWACNWKVGWTRSTRAITTSPRIRR